MPESYILTAGQLHRLSAVTDSLFKKSMPNTLKVNKPGSLNDYYPGSPQDCLEEAEVLKDIVSEILETVPDET